MGEPLIRYASDLTQQLLAQSQPAAWQRAEWAAQKAECAVAAMERPRGDVVIASAWLHAIGEVSELRLTGLPALDGAIHLLGTGWPSPVVSLVAHHTQSRLLAESFNASGQLALIERIQGWPSDILDYAIVMSSAPPESAEPEACLRKAADALPASLVISASKRTERDRRLRRAVHRVASALIVHQAATQPQGA